MNILTDILSLLKRKQFITVAGEEDVLVLGVHEPPEIEGIASPVPYKNVKLIKVKDFVDFNKCIHRNVPVGDSAYAGVFRDETEDLDGECYVNLRRLKSLSLNLTITENGDFIDFENLAEANTVINVGTGAEVYKDKIGEEFRLRTLVSSDASVTITQNADEIDFVVASPSVNIYNADGILTGNRLLDGNSTHSLTFDNLTAFRAGSLGGTIQLIDTDAGIGIAEAFIYGGGGLSLSFTDLLTGPTAVNKIDFFGSSFGGFIVTDTADNRGMVYAADYSPNFINESLVTKRYVDAQIGANNELSEVLANGNTMLGAQTIDAAVGNGQISLSLGGVADVVQIDNDSGGYGQGWFYLEGNRMQAGYSSNYYEAEGNNLRMRLGTASAARYLSGDADEIQLGENIPLNTDTNPFKVFRTDGGAVTLASSGGNKVVALNNAVITANLNVDCVVALAASGGTLKTDHTAYLTQAGFIGSGDAFEGLLVRNTLTADRTYTLQDGDGTLAFLSDITDLTFQTLSSGLIGWDVTNGVNAEVTLTGASILSVTNAQDGDYGTLIVRQDAIGGHTLALPANFKVVNGGGGAITLSTGANEEDVLSWVYDGTDFYVSFGLNFT